MRVTVFFFLFFSKRQKLLYIESVQKMDRRVTGYRLYRYCSHSARALFTSCSVAEQQHVQSLSRECSTVGGREGCVKYKFIFLATKQELIYTEQIL